ncbi:MAG: ATP-binding protein, partial [Actinobacteria bacterium]
MGNEKFKVAIEKLKDVQDPKLFKFESTADIEPLVGTIGQDRALEALQFGTGVETEGYNIYAAGPIGTGKETTVKSFIEKLAKEKDIPQDWVYVYNFKNKDRPKSIPLPPGRAKEFTKDMHELIEGAKNEIPRAFESEEYEKRRTKIINDFQDSRDNAMTEMQEKAAEQGYAVEITTAGIVTIPLIGGKPMKRERFAKLKEADKKRISEKGEKVQNKINELLRSLRQEEKNIKDEVKKLDKEIALFAIGHLLDEIRSNYKEYPKIIDYLNQVDKDIIAHLDDFKGKGKDEAALAGLEMMRRHPSFERYKVNVLVDNTNTKGAPVIFEENPGYYNLFGKIEYRPELGAAVTNFNMVKPGAVHRANGGYLVIRAFDILTNYFSWQALKRTLRRQEIKIENLAEQYQAIPVTTIRPQPVPVDVKVVLLGSPYIYMLLYYLDEDFRKLFKVKADFNTEMKRTEENAEKYAQFVSGRARIKNLKHFAPSAISKIVEYGSWLAGDQQKLSTRFQEIGNVVSESSYWASQNGNENVVASDVENAIEHKTFRSNMIEEKMQDQIKSNTIFIDTEGMKVGQANGLSIISVGDYYFGRPSRVTAKVAMGQKGVVNIEREAKLGGPIYNKGVFILTGYMEGKYGGDKPLAVTASLTFEQEYGGIEGDSASSTELYSILSALSEVPLRQDIAITGSINQNGEVQPIGGVNRKIEGFFKTAKERGLSGNQGVMIPEANIKNLMLKDEVVNAVKEGKFNIYAVKTIDEGIKLLTGKAAGERQEDGSYP